MTEVMAMVIETTANRLVHVCMERRIEYFKDMLDTFPHAFTVPMDEDDRYLAGIVRCEIDRLREIGSLADKHVIESRQRIMRELANKMEAV